MKFSIFALPLIACAGINRRDDNTDGGGAPSGSGYGAPQETNWLNKPGENPIPPSRDSFYKKIPSDVSKYTNGHIIEKRNMSLSGTYAGIDTAYQVKLKTEDAHGTSAVTWASILIPRNDMLTGNVVVFQVPEDAVSIDCSPTYQLFGKNAIPEVQALISEGYTVVVPDYEGQRNSYTVGKLAGKQILDAARAALSLPGIKHSNQTTSVGLWGYGTSGYSTGWAGEIAESYAPDVPLKGYALGGVITNLLGWMHNINASPFSGNFVSSLLGMASEYKDVDDALQDTLVPHRRDQFNEAASRCTTENVFHYFNSNITSTYFTPGSSILDDERVKNVYNFSSLGQNAPKSSVFVYLGSEERVAPIGDAKDTLSKYCKSGTVVQYTELSGQTHSMARGSYSGALDYFKRVFNGQPIEDTCSTLTSSDNY